MAPLAYGSVYSLAWYKKQVQTLYRDCPLCGHDNQQTRPLPWSPAPWVLRSCEQCDMIYLENPPAAEALEEDMAWEKSFAKESAERRKREPVIAALSAIGKRLRRRRNKFLKLAREYFPEGRILDVGCGSGHLLAQLPADYIPFGVEVSRALAAYADGQFARRGGKVIQAPAILGMEHFESQSFDGVAMISYLEHELQPMEALRAARRLMKAGARLILKTPNTGSWNRAVRKQKWCGFRWPDHVNYFIPEVLVNAVQKAGFTIVRFGPADWLPTSDNMWMVAEKPSA